MARPVVSLIVVSRDRPYELAAHLSCLRFQTAIGFETIVVSNLPAPTGYQPNPLIHIDCQEANISLARNLGIERAQGGYIIFCDDDCLPEPNFLARMTQPFEDLRVGAVGGVTRGANGVGTQWDAAGFGRDGVDYPLKLNRTAPYTVFEPRLDKFVKTVGTACAFRADALRAIGGFDPAYRYYFDETDVNLRMSEAGWATAIVPRAQVHHAFAAGPHRDSRRLPRDLFEIGASSARFAHMHNPESASQAIDLRRRLQRRRVYKQFNLGLFDGARLQFLLSRLDEGLKFGAADSSPKPVNATLPESTASLASVTTAQRDHFLLCGSQSEMGNLAGQLAKRGKIVTLLELRPNAQPLWAYFNVEGYWYHQGGLFGQIQRRGYIVQFRTRQMYIDQETARLACFRPVNYLISTRNFRGPAAILPELANISEMSGMILKSVDNP